MRPPPPLSTLALRSHSQPSLSRILVIWDAFERHFHAHAREPVLCDIGLRKSLDIQGRLVNTPMQQSIQNPKTHSQTPRLRSFGVSKPNPSLSAWSQTNFLFTFLSLSTHYPCFIKQILNHKHLFIEKQLSR